MQIIREELLDTVKDRPTGRPMRLVVGVADVRLFHADAESETLTLDFPSPLPAGKTTPFEAGPASWMKALLPMPAGSVSPPGVLFV